MGHFCPPWSGSGSTDLIESGSNRIRFLNTAFSSRVTWSKNSGKSLFLKKIAFYIYIYPEAWIKPSALKREHPALQNMKFLNLCGSFLPSWIRIHWPDWIWIQPDTDPKHCFYSRVTLVKNLLSTFRSILRPGSSVWLLVWPFSSSTFASGRQAYLCAFIFCSGDGVTRLLASFF